jgi:hypothetical protein
MSRTVFALVAVIGALLAAPARAQTRYEVGGFYGWTFVDGSAFRPPSVAGPGYAQADARDSSSYGFTVGVISDWNVGVEFLWGRQATTLDVTGAGPTRSGRMNIDSYHFQVVWESGAPESPGHLFVLGGIGATHYGDVVLSGKTAPGETRFSWVFGGGLKVYPSRRVGVKAMLRFVPTYIDAWETGLRCDLTPDCWTNSGAANSIQIELSGGVIVRF